MVTISADLLVENFLTHAAANAVIPGAEYVGDDVHSDVNGWRIFDHAQLIEFILQPFVEAAH